MKKLIPIISILVLQAFLEAKYTSVQLDVPKQTRNKDKVTYFTTDKEGNKFKVELDPEDVRILESVIKQHVMWDSDYNIRITRGFIRRVVGSCVANCPANTELVRKVLTDFLGKPVQEMFSRVGITRNL